MEKLRFSIVIPTYNRREFIDKTIASCLDQAFDSFEVIVIDDGSKDGTHEMLTREYSLEPRLRCIRVENGERGRARNIGFDESKGNYVIFLDSDDRLNKGCLQAISQYLDQHPDTDFLAGRYLMDRDGKMNAGPLMDLTAGVYDHAILLKGNPFACNVIVRKGIPNYSPFQESRDLTTMEDWIYLLENMTHAKIVLLDMTTVIMNDHAERSMHSDHTSVIAARMRAMEFALEHLHLGPPEQKTLKAYSYYFCGIHAYLGSQRILGIKSAYRSMTYGGPFLKNGILIAKLLIGRPAILKLRGQ